MEVFPCIGLFLIDSANFYIHKSLNFVQMTAVWIGTGLGWPPLMIPANRSSAHACANELAAPRSSGTDVHVCRYCKRSIYLVLPGRDGWSAPSGHMHASTPVAATRHEGLATGGERWNDHHVHVITCVWVPCLFPRWHFCLFMSCSPSIIYSLFIHPCASPESSSLSVDTQMHHIPGRLQDIDRKRAIVSRTGGVSVWVCVSM